MTKERDEIEEILEELLIHSPDCDKRKCDCGILETAKKILRWVNKNYVPKKDVWISDRNCPENKMYFMDIDNWAKYNGYEKSSLT
jgi:hypothetical protein